MYFNKKGFTQKEKKNRIKMIDEIVSFRKDLFTLVYAVNKSIRELDTTLLQQKDYKCQYGT